MSRPYHDEVTLRSLYHDEGLSGIEIADRFGVAAQTIYDWMDKHGIERTTPDTDAARDEARLRRLYLDERLSINQIADRLDVTYTTVQRAMDEFDIERRSFGAHQIPDQLRDGDWLETQHNERGLTITDIANEVGCSWKAVSRAFDRHGIENRWSTDLSDDAAATLEDEAELRRLYFDEQMSQIDIAEVLDVDQGTVSNWFNRHGIEARSQSDITGTLHPRYNPDAEPHVYDKKWRRVRETVIERDGAECRGCGIGRDEHRAKHGMDLDVHHITPQHEVDNKYDIENLITMCRSCHITEEQSDGGV